MVRVSIERIQEQTGLMVRCEHRAVTQTAWHRASPWLLAGVLGVAGTAHFLFVDRYQRTIPSVLPYPRELVYLSGAAELLCAGGLAFQPTRRLAGWATAALFVVVFPANVKMALDSAGDAPTGQLIAWGRLPLQVPLVLWAAQVARGTRPRIGDHDATTGQRGRPPAGRRLRRG